MLIFCLALAARLAFAHGHHAPPFTPFAWDGETVSSYDAFATVAQRVTDPVLAERLKAAATPNGAEVFGAVLDRITDPAAADRYAEVFGVEHPVFGSPERLRATHPEHRHQLLRLGTRGFGTGQLAELHRLAPELTYHGVKHLRRRIGETEKKPIGFAAWRYEIMTAQLHCDGYLADARREIKKARFETKTALAFDLLVLAERHITDSVFDRLGFEGLWHEGDRAELYKEYARYQERFEVWAARVKDFSRRTRGPGWRSLLARRDAELRITYLENCAKRVQKRLDLARERVDRFNEGLREAPRLLEFDEATPLPFKTFDETIYRDVATDIAIAVEVGRLRERHAELTALIYGR